MSQKNSPLLAWTFTFTLFTLDQVGHPRVKLTGIEGSLLPDDATEGSTQFVFGMIDSSRSSFTSITLLVKEFWKKVTDED